MKNILYIITILISFYSIFSQNVKTKNWSMKYEYLPEKVPVIKYHTYKIMPVNEATDNVPLVGTKSNFNLNNSNINQYRPLEAKFILE